MLFLFITKYNSYPSFADDDYYHPLQSIPWGTWTISITRNMLTLRGWCWTEDEQDNIMLYSPIHPRQTSLNHANVWRMKEKVHIIRSFHSTWDRLLFLASYVVTQRLDVELNQSFFIHPVHS